MEGNGMPAATAAGLVSKSMGRWLRIGSSEAGSSGWWKTGLIVGVTTGSVIAGTYLLFRLTSSGRSESRNKKCDQRNGSACKSLTSADGIRVNHIAQRLSLPVTSRARTALEFEDAEPVNGMTQVDGGFLSPLSLPYNSAVHSLRRRNDSITSGTTTLLITSRSPAELLLYGLESLKRSVRLMEEARDKLLLDDESRDQKSVDSELESIVCKAKQLQDDVDSYLRESFPEETVLIDSRSQQADDINCSAARNALVDPHHMPGRLSRHDSLNSLATSITMPFFDIEPNLHFFKLYTQSLDNYEVILEPRTDRSKQVLCDTHDEFIAKVHCLRQAFSQILSQEENRIYFAELGRQILSIFLSHSPKDPSVCMSAYERMLDYISDPDNSSSITQEVAIRKIPSDSFYDLVLDYMILESFDDLQNPPSAVTSVANNRWLSSGFRELALQTAVSAVLKHKRSKLPVRAGFFDHFYDILEHISPILAWGFLGTDIELKFKCELIKDAVTRLVRSYFSFDRVRYTSLTDLTEDILRVTDQEYDQLRKQLNCGR